MPTILTLGPKKILDGVTTVSEGEIFEVSRRIVTPMERVFHATGATSAGAGAATIVIEVSCDETAGDDEWVTLGTITLVLGTISVGDGFASSANWPYLRGNVTAISGTNAAVTLYVGV